MSYTISLDNALFEKNKKNKISRYSSIKYYKISGILGIFIILIICVQDSIYPSWLIKRMEQAGLVTFVNFENVQIKKTESRKPRGKKNPSIYLVGSYKDHNNINQDVKIHLIVADIDMVDRDEIKKNNNTYPGAYFTFYPSWSFIRESSSISVYFFYSILSLLIVIVLYNYFKLNSIMKHFVVGTMVKPLSFGTKAVKRKHSIIYQHFVLWDTPKGKLYESCCYVALKYESITLDFGKEYCGMYLEDNSGRCLLIAPNNVPTVIKKYGYIIKADHTVIHKVRNSL